MMHGQKNIKLSKVEAVSSSETSAIVYQSRRH